MEAVEEGGEASELGQLDGKEPPTRQVWMRVCTRVWATATATALNVGRQR
jgi:hypothetical protein